MKRNKFFKSLLVSFLALTMVFTVGAVKAHADETPTVTAEKFEATFTAEWDSKEYTYKVTSSDKEMTVKLADILKNLKTADGVKLQDVVLVDINDGKTSPTSYLDTTNLDTEKTTLKVPGFTGKTTDADNKVEALSFKVVLGAAKVDAKFTSTNPAYTATIKVDNPKNFLAPLGKIEVSLSEISKGLLDANGTAPATEQVVTQIGGTSVATLADEEDKDLVSIALNNNDLADNYAITLSSSFTSVAYAPATDSITIAGVPEGVTLKYAIVKADANSTVSAGSFKDVPDGAKGAVDNGKYSITFSLSDKTKGISVAPTKDTLIYFTALVPNKDKTHYNPTITVKAAVYSKIKVNLNYAKAQATDVVTTADLGVLSLDVTTAATKEKSTVEYENIPANLAYSTDEGKTWISAVDGDAESKNKFTAAKLYTYVIKEKAEKVLFRYNGTAPTDDKPAVDNVRNSKPVSVSIKVAGKAAKSIKLDVKKCTLAVKNGYDYSVQIAKGAENWIPALSEWTTILPYNKKGSATGADAKEPTSTYIPAAKCTDATVDCYTKDKISGIDVLAEFAEKKSVTGYKNELSFYVRKSATVSKPAQKATVVTIAEQAAFQSELGKILTYDADIKVGNFYAVADEKGALVIPALTGAETYDFEYAIVLEADNDTKGIDWSTVKWTKMAEGKTIVVGKSSTTYKLVGVEEAKTVTLSAETTNNKGTCYIIVRKAGDSKKGILPSLNLVTEVRTIEATGASPVDVIVWADKAPDSTPTPTPTPNPEE